MARWTKVSLGLVMLAAMAPGRPALGQPAASEPKATPAGAAVAPAGDAAAPATGEADPAVPEDSAEIIVMERRWPGVDLVDARHTSRATAVVSPSDARTAATLGDHLAGQAGIVVQRTGPGQGVPIVRGLIGSAVLVMVDGIRLNNAIFRPAPNQYSSLVDPWRVETITVVKGPGSAPFGSDALGGVVVVQTPLPVFLQPQWQARSEVTVAAATADQSSVGHASLAAGRAGLGLAASLTLEDHGDLRSGSGVRQEPSAYRAFGGQLTGHWDRGDSASTAWLQLYEQPELPRTDELRPGYGQDAAAAEVWVYRPSRRLMAHVRELRRGLWGLDGLELHAAYQRIDDDRRIRDTGDPEELREQISDHGFTALARAAGTAGSTSLLGGLEAQHDRVDCARVTLDTTTGMSTPATCRFPDGSTMSQLGLFAEARRALGARLEARLGLRGGLSALRITGDADSRADLTTADWAAELGLELRATSELSVLANLGRGFRAPNVNDLTGLGPRPGNRFQEPAASLTNEHATGADVGVRWRRDGVEAEGYLFALQHDGRIDVVPTGRMTDSGRQIVVSDNVGTTRTLGAELAGSVQARSDLRLHGSLTWVRGTKDDRGDGEEPADRIPPLGGRIAARWTPARQLELDAEARFSGAQRRLSARDRDDPRIDPSGTDRFVTLAVGARYAWPALAISARVENLADAQYREHGSGVDAPGIDGRLMLHWTGDY